MIRSSSDGTELPVYVALPSQRNGPSSAVVVFHGSGGSWDDQDTNGDGIGDLCNVGMPSKQTKEWRDLLTNNGFVAVFADSYSPRGTCENEGIWKDPPAKFKISGTFVRNRDAYDVLEFIRSLGWSEDHSLVVDPEKIGIMGFSDGGTSVISTLYDFAATPSGWTWKQSFNGATYTKEILAPPHIKAEDGFKAGVVFYPGAYHNGYYGKLCDGQGIYRSYCDIQFHLAEDDDLTANTYCLINTIQQNGGGSATVYEYQGTQHGFDGNSTPQSNDARDRTVNFFKSKLK